MYGLQKWVWASVIALAGASSASAQNTTGGTGGINSGGQTGGLPLGGGSTALGNSGGFGGGGFGAGSGSGSGGGVGTPQTINPSGIAAPTGSYSSSLDPSNRFAGYYANPYFAGNQNPTNGVPNPGGFGTPLSGSGGTSGARGARGATANTSITRNTFGTQAGAGGLGGGRGNTNAANQSGIVVPLAAPIAYTAQFRFPTPAPAPAKIQIDVRAALDNTSMILNSKLIKVEADLNNNVTLSGSAADDDEIRLIEGMVRLTPGVGDIKNELIPIKPSR
ncbi:MAG: BON domain-containing protein [Planctomycetes bacterium]|nr:BON domain-containing protein [Planctomycetota bacterium]